MARTLYVSPEMPHGEGAGEQDQSSHRRRSLSQFARQGATLDNQLNLHTRDVSFNKYKPAHSMLTPLWFSQSGFRSAVTDEERDFMKNLFRHLTPSGRAEMVLLSNWLDDTVDNIKRRFDADEDVDSFQVSLGATCKLAFSELVRQVSVHCVERGVALSRVWNLTLSLMAMDRPLEVDPRKFQKAQVFHTPGPI